MRSDSTFGGKPAEDGRHGNGADLGSEAVFVEFTTSACRSPRGEADQWDSQCDCILCIHEDALQA
jgi:hypothetical protein